MGLHRPPVNNISILQMPEDLYTHIVLRVTNYVEMVSNGGTPVVSDVRNMFSASGIKCAFGLSDIENTAPITSDHIDKVIELTGEGSMDRELLFRPLDVCLAVEKRTRVTTLHTTSMSARRSRNIADSV